MRNNHTQTLLDFAGTLEGNAGEAIRELVEIMTNQPTIKKYRHKVTSKRVCEAAYIVSVG
jgi:hypothetical protein